MKYLFRVVNYIFKTMKLYFVKNYVSVCLLRKVKKGSLLIDSSTIDPMVSKELAKEVEKMGAVFMDAPVSGGVGAAPSGNLTFMVGGVEEEFAAAQELLGCMGSNVVYCGAVGTGQAAKICNNLLLAISMIGTAEAMNLGIRLGLDPKLLAKILNMSSGRCWSSDTYNPVPGVVDGVPSANNYQGRFGTTLMAKDLGLAQDSATSTKSPILLGSQAHQIYRMMCAKGYSKNLQKKPQERLQSLTANQLFQQWLNQPY